MDGKPKTNETHTVMSKKLAQALMDAGVKHFDGGGILGGLGDILGTNSTFKAEGPKAQNQNFLPQIATQQQRQTDVYGQQQNLANTLLQQSQGQGPNPAQAMLAQQTGANVANQAALMAGQRGASANPGLIARQAAMQGGNLQQQSVGQGASLQAQQQLAAQQALQQQQSQMQNAALQGESIQQGGLASQNNAALGVQQINANTASQNAAGNRGLIGGLIGGGASALASLGFAHGGEVPDQKSLAQALPHYAMGGMGMENYAMSAPIAQWQDPTGGAVPVALPTQREAPTTVGVAQPWEQGGGLAGGPMDAGQLGVMPAYAAHGGQIPSFHGDLQAAQAQQKGYPSVAKYMRTGSSEPYSQEQDDSEADRYLRTSNVGGGAAPFLFAGGGNIPFSNALLSGGKVPGKASVKGDSEENDTQPTMLSAGEAVIPRSIMNSPDMEKKALEFLRHLKKKKGYSDVADAKVKKKACGGRV